MFIKKMIAVTALVFAAIGLSACESDADMASRDLSVQAEQFQIERRVVFYNIITGEYILEIIGRCSIEDQTASGTPQLEVTCKTDEDKFKKHFLGLADNNSYFAEQLEAVDANDYNYRVIFKPETIIPAFDLETSNDKTFTEETEVTEER